MRFGTEAKPQKSVPKFADLKGSTVAIATCKYTSNFTIIGNECLNDDDLSPDALGVLCYLRSKPVDWQVMQTQLASRFKCGRERIARILKELISFGYMEKTQDRDPATNKWRAVDYLVFGRKSAAPADQQAAVRVSRTTAFPTLLSTDLLPSTDSTKEDNSPRTACAVEASDRDHCPRTYRQSPAEQARAWGELKRLDGWPPDWSREEMTHWHALLRNGHAADDIVDVAERFLRKTSEWVVPSREDFLQCFESYLEDEADEADDASSLPPMQHATAPDHHHAHAFGETL